MSNGKGDQRRPTQIDERQFEFNWDQTFKKPEQESKQQSTKGSNVQWQDK